MILGEKPHGAGRSSFEFVGLNHVLEALSLTPTTVFLDLGCGRGNYTIAVAESIGPQGKVYGIDVWQEGLAELKDRASARGFNNIQTIHANLNEHIPLESATIDVCFMATVLHDLLRDDSGEVVMHEIARVLKPGGKLAIIEFKKIENSPGPPIAVRLSAEEVEETLAPFGFWKKQVIDSGPYHYSFVAILEE